MEERVSGSGISQKLPDHGQTPEAQSLPHIVVGAGPVGTRAAQELAKRDDRQVLLFGDEKWGSYNRVKLTPLLAREVNLGQIQQPLDPSVDASVERHDSTRIVAIDREARCVQDHQGNEYPFQKLVIATGSRPFRPDIPGIGLANVFTFRSLDDVEGLIARAQTARRVVVIGGGLLGLEAARGMQSRGAKVTVVEAEPWLMFRQLDREAGEKLRQAVEEIGIEVHTSTLIKEIAGDSRVEKVVLAREQQELACDTVIICTGIRPNKEIAGEAGLAFGRGITVDAAMRTSDPDIYAVGECAEFNEQLEGLVAPGLEQARIAATNAAGGSATYERAEPTTRLKVMGASVFSAGDIDQVDQRADLQSYMWRDGGAYRRLVMRKGRLIGAIAIGPWDGIGYVQQLVQNRGRLGFAALRKFTKTGALPGQKLPASVIAWPEATTICNCTGVTRGQLGAAMASGCETAEQLAQMTSASTVCGTCKPLLQELVGSDAAPEPVKFATHLLALAFVAFLGAVSYWVLPPIAFEDSFNPDLTLQDFFRDGLLKQITGFTLLGLAVIAAALSLRKRVRWLQFGGYASWRLVHLVIGVLALVTLVLHSGLRLGINLNGALLLSFLGVLIAGGVAGAAVAQDHKLATLGPVKTRKADPRGWSWWVHMLLVWPLPVLLSLHILTVYLY